MSLTKSMIMCTIIIIKDHKMKQIFLRFSQDHPRIIFKFFNNQKCHGGFTALFLFNAFILSHHQRSHMPNDTDQ